MNTHPFVVMEYEGQKVEIDEELAGLMEVCWYYGIRTDETCQGDENDQEVFIAFPTASDMLTFVACCVSGETTDLVERIERRWRVECLPLDLLGLARYEYNGGDLGGPSQGGAFLSCVNFPREDLPGLADRLREGCANAAEWGPSPYADPAVAAGCARMLGRLPMAKTE